MLPTRTLLKSMRSCILITLLIKSIAHATPVRHVTNVVLPEAHTYFVPNPALDKHADTVHRRLKSLGDSALVYPLGIEDHEQQVASQHVRTWLEGQVHVQNLLHLGSRPNSHTYAFLLPETPEVQRLVGGGMDPASARMGVFTVHLDRGNRAHDGIYVNGFLGLERVQDRNALEHRILVSPKTHDLESLLIATRATGRERLGKQSSPRHPLHMSPCYPSMSFFLSTTTSLPFARPRLTSSVILLWIFRLYIAPPESAAIVTPAGSSTLPSATAEAAGPAESLIACRTCKRPQPASQFQHQRFANKRVINCLSCRAIVTPYPTVSTSRRPVIPAAPRAAPVSCRIPTQQPSSPVITAPAPAPAPAPAAVQHSSTPQAAIATPLTPTLQAALPNTTTLVTTLPLEPAVTQSDLAELRQTLQDDLTETLRGLLTTHFSSLAQSTLPIPANAAATSTAASSTTAPTPAVALPTPTGESLAQLSGFPWVAPDLADKVYNDTLPAHDLPKLASPTWVQDQDESTSFTVNGIVFNKSVSSATSGKQFAKSFPTFTSFWRVWIVYSQLRTYQASDRAIGVGLGTFLLHIQELEQVFPWPRVVDYILTVCIKRFGKATSADWLRTDTEAHFTCFQGVQGRTATTSQSQTTKRLLPPREDDPRRSQVCFSWNNSKCSGSEKRPCIRQHVCSKCRGSHPSKGCTTSPDAAAGVKKQS